MGDIARVLNHDNAGSWSVERLRRTVQRLGSEGIVKATLLDRARRQQGDDRLARLVAGIAAAAPDRTLQQIAMQLVSADMQNRSFRVLGAAGAALASLKPPGERGFGAVRTQPGRTWCV